MFKSKKLRTGRNCLFRISSCIFICSLLFLLSFDLKSQIPKEYEVAVWPQFKSAAVTYTFDDNTKNQLPIAIPILDKYNFKSTLFVVTNWSPDWQGLKKASENGHEIASHTVSHPSLNTIPLANQETELKQSQTTILSNIPAARCQTIAYPNCNVGDLPLIQSSYLAGRICNNNIVSSTPSDFYNIGSIIAGANGVVKTAADFNSKIALAKASNGWCVFLLHGIDHDGGYSSTSSSEFETHIQDVKNAGEYWVATFEGVVKYIKERNAIALEEIMINADSIHITADDHLDDSVFDLPVTVKRQMPAGWEGVRVHDGNKPVESSIKIINGVKYIIFDIVPNKEAISLSNAQAVVTAIEDAPGLASLSVSPNPFAENTTVSVKGSFIYLLSTIEGKVLQRGEGINETAIGNGLSQGIYLLKVYRNREILGSKIIKK
jgi:hypothetical protein